MYLFDGTKAIWLNWRDTTYRLSPSAVGGQYTRTLLYWQKEIAKYLKTPSKIKLRADTVIDQTPYNVFLVNLLDTVEKNARVYHIVEIITGKTTGLPRMITAAWKGFADDGAYMGMFEQHIFEDYQLEPVDFPDIAAAHVPAGFKLPVKKQALPMLEAGSAAPDLKLTDLAGKAFDFKSLHGKIVLLNFTTDGCPHCINAA